MKVCLVLTIGRDAGFFLVDLDRGIYGAVADENVFDETLPNFRIRAGRQSFRVCVVNDTVYLFYFTPGNTLIAPEVYQMELSPTVLGMSKVIMEKTMLERIKDAMASKVHMAAAGNDSRHTIVLFSTCIKFNDKQIDAGRIDFEIYDPRGIDSRKLPQLHICPLSRSGGCPLFTFCAPGVRPGRAKAFSVTLDPKVRIQSETEFHIVSYAVYGNRFYIGTDFDRMFYIDLVDDGKWTLYDRGYEFFARNENFIGPGDVCMNAYGACFYERERETVWLRGRGRDKGKIGDHPTFYPMRKGNGRGLFIPFPLSSVGDNLQLGRGYYASACTFLGCSATGGVMKTCSVRIAYESSSIVKGGSRKLHWLIDVFTTDVRMIKMLELSEVNAEKFVERISFKFCLKDDLVVLSQVSGLFPVRFL